MYFFEVKHSMENVFFHQVFKVNRHGENERFQPFKELHNRRLLWHGSRNTNYAGILSQGLRIAPPEAPVVSFFWVHLPLRWLKI